MAKNQRFLLKQFAESAQNNGIFGSYASGIRQTTNNVDEIQSLPAWLNGWLSAASKGTLLPRLEEMQSLQYVLCKSIIENYREGVPAWLPTETYYNNSIVSYADDTHQFGLYYNVTGGYSNVNPAEDKTNWGNLGELLLSQVGIDENYISTNTISNKILHSIDTSSYQSVNSAYYNLGCQIENNVVSGFGEKSFVILTKTFPTAESWKITNTITTPTDLITQQAIVSMPTLENSIGIVEGVVYLSLGGNIYKGTTTLSASTQYNVVAEYNGTAYVVTLSTGTTTSEEIRIENPQQYFGGKTIALGWGGSDYPQNFFRGTMSFPTIETNGTTYWNSSTVSNADIVHFSGNYFIFAPNGYNVNGTYRNVNIDKTLDSYMIYTPVNGEKTVLVTQSGEIMARQGYTESDTEPTNPQLNDVWYDTENNYMYQYNTQNPNFESESVGIDKGNVNFVTNSGYTIVGNLTDNNGVLRGFSSSNYATIPNFDTSKPWEIILRIASINAITAPNCFFANKAKASKISLNVSSSKHFLIYLSSNGSSADIANGIQGSYTFAANTANWVKFGWSGSTYTLYYSSDGVTWIKDIEVQSSLPLNQNDTSGFRLGVSDVSNNPWTGLIYANDCSASVDNIVVWLAKKGNPQITLPVTVNQDSMLEQFEINITTDSVADAYNIAKLGNSELYINNNAVHWDVPVLSYQVGINTGSSSVPTWTQIKYVPVNGTGYLESGMQLYSSADCITEEGTATGTDYQFTGQTGTATISNSVIVDPNANYQIGTVYIGGNYTLTVGNNMSEVATPAKPAPFDAPVVLGIAVEDYTPALSTFNGTIDLSNTGIDGWKWNGSSTTKGSWNQFIGGTIGKIKDNGTNITALNMKKPIELLTGDKETIISWCMPDYTAVVNISSFSGIYQIPVNALLCLSVYDNGNKLIMITDESGTKDYLGIGAQTGTGSFNACYTVVGAGTYIKWSRNSGNGEVKYFPLKGGQNA